MDTTWRCPDISDFDFPEASRPPKWLDGKKEGKDWSQWSRKLKKCAFSVARYFSDQNSLRTEASRVGSV